jgi:hypothetical protein
MKNIYQKNTYTEFLKEYINAASPDIPHPVEHPVESSLQLFVIRRKDIAEKMLQICVDNDLTIQETLNVLYFFVSLFRTFPFSGAVSFLKTEKTPF